MQNDANLPHHPASPGSAAHNSPTPISDGQRRANQANAQFSTGPRTEAGKARAAMNARRHGLTGQFFVMNEADRLAYIDFERGILESLQPAGPYENQLAVSIAQDHWRLNRSRAIEFNTFGLGHEEYADSTNAATPEVHAALTQAYTWRKENRGFTNITLYEGRVSRMITRHKKELAELQADRKAAEDLARAEAELLLRQSVMRGETLRDDQPVVIECPSHGGLIPASLRAPGQTPVYGFVFSPSNLIAAINHKAALASARFYEKNDWNPNISYKEDPKLSSISVKPLPKAA